MRGGDARASDSAHLAIPEEERVAVRRGRAQTQAAQPPVRLAAVVKAGDGLLADVAALLEVDRPLDDPGLGGHRLRPHVKAEARPPRLHPDDLRRLFAEVYGPGSDQLPVNRVDRVRPSDQVEALVGGDGEDLDPVAVGVVLGVLRRELGDARRLSGGGPDQRGDHPVLRRVGDLDVATDLVHLEVLSQRLRGDRLGVEPDRPRVRVAQAQSPHVGHQVALAVEQRRVAAPVGLHRLEVVGELTLQVAGGVGAADQQRPSLPDQEAGLLPEGPVLPVELDLGRCLGHPERL